ncbi:MAG: hypothetical protein V1867_00135 [Candidatus Falkowbacteria bacterium]
MNQEEVDEIRKTHPLYQKNIKRFHETWPEWKENFTKAQIGSELIGLLHRGFDVNTDREEEQDRIGFYLEVAYGHNNSFLFHRPLGINCPNEEYRLAAETKKIAQKAWAMLCQKFFKEDNGSSGSGWRRLSHEPRVFDRIMWFFSETTNIPHPHSENHHDIIALKFLANFSTYAWEEKWGTRMESGLRFAAKRPLFIKILNEIKRLDILTKYWRELSPDDLVSLEEIALEDGRYTTLAQAAIAAVNGSQAAQATIVLKVVIAENERQKKIEEAELEIEEARQKLKSLSE